MQHSENNTKWIEKDRKRKLILMAIKQPLTAKQISRKTGIDLDTCSYVLGKFVLRDLMVCMNPAARSSRVYWTTSLGRSCQERFQKGFTEALGEVSSVDWDLYGWTCFSHRQAVLRTLVSPMQPSEIKRAMRMHQSDVKISANNIRDVMRLFLKRGLVRKVFFRKKAHPRYELTETGTKLRELLLKAELPL